MKLHERIKANRIRCGLSQEQLAEKMDVSRQAVTKWESGQSAPSTEKLFKLAEVFGTTVDLLLPAEEPKKTRFDSAGALKIAAAFLGLFLIARFLCTKGEIHSIRYWLIDNDVGSFTYLYGWLLYRGFWWYAMGLCILTAFFRKTAFAWTGLSGFTAGLILGECLGPYPAGAAFGHGHYGWAIWGGCWLVSMILGLIGQRMQGRGVALKSRSYLLWLFAYTLCIVAVTGFILLSRAIPTGH